MISLKDIGRWTDVSAVRTDVTMAEVEEMIKVVRECRCICASPMPWITKYRSNTTESSSKIISM